MDDEDDGGEKYDDDEEKEEDYDGENGGESDEENDDEEQGAAMTDAGTADDVAVGAVPLAFTCDGCRGCVAIVMVRSGTRKC